MYTITFILIIPTHQTQVVIIIKHLNYYHHTLFLAWQLKQYLLRPCTAYISEPCQPPEDDEKVSKEKEQEVWYVTCSYLKASVGTYHVCDYPHYSTFWHCHPYFTLQFYANFFFFYTCCHLYIYIIYTLIFNHRRYYNDTFILQIVILPPEVVWVIHNVMH